jgi:hypothetical protein
MAADCFYVTFRVLADESNDVDQWARWVSEQHDYSVVWGPKLDVDEIVVSEEHMRTVMVTVNG